jgi:flagellar biosynthesis protein FliQ
VDAFSGLLRDASIVTAVLALPVLALAALIGTAIAIVQAATQVQEQTLTLLPKVVVVGTLTVAGGAPAMQLLAGLFVHALASIPALVAGT